MEKDFTKAYITEAFRVYARMGKPTYEQARESIFKKELAKRADLSPEKAIESAERALDAQAPLLLDIEAVNATLDLLHEGGKKEIIAAIFAVYFTDPHSPIRRGDISNRVRRFAYTSHYDERNIYRWLKHARLLCATLRGIRISDADERRYKTSLEIASCQ
ncbi:MAG: hypothetical protein J6D11_04740 [Clostridia bacterium]|nr:hypothetical protein [Clostridia bacterium]